MTIETHQLRLAASLFDDLAGDPDFTNEERAQALHLADRCRDIAAQQAKDLRTERRAMDELYYCGRRSAA